MIEDAAHVPSPDLAGSNVDADIEDEALATAARARYRTDGIVTIEPDHTMRVALSGDEELLALRQTASVERLPQGAQSTLTGRLALTTRRLLMVDERPVTLASLEDLDDVTLVTDRLLVMLTSGTGFTIHTPHPRLLRVEMAEARASRMDRQTAASSSVAAGLPSAVPPR